MTDERRQLLRDRIPPQPIIILTAMPDSGAEKIGLQGYVIGGETVFPMFSSLEAASKSTDGQDLGRPMFSLDRRLLVSMLKGDEVFLLDAQLPTETRFTSEEFKAAFPEPYELPKEPKNTKGPFAG